MSVVIPSLRAAIAVPGWAKNELWRKARAVPSLDLRFADNKSLTDAVTGASLVTFTRDSNGTYTDSARVIQTASTNVPRFDHNPTTGESLGLLVEEQRTNGIRNNTMVGAVAGTPGTNPNFWQYVTAQSNGLTQTIVGVGTENGITYIDYRFNGTTVASPNAIAFGIDSATAATGQAWTNSLYWKLAGGTTTGVTAWQIGIIELTAIGGFVTGANYTQTAPSSAALITQRPAATRTLSGGVTIGQVQMTLAITLTGNTAIDITLRIGLPQLEQGAFATSVIPTTTAAATRSADVASITGSAFTSFYSQSAGTLFSNARTQQSAAGHILAGVSTGSFASSAYLSKESDNLLKVAPDAAPSNLGISLQSVSSNVGLRVALAFTAGTGSASAVMNGGTVGTDASTGIPITMSQMGIGTAPWNIGTNLWNGHIARLTYWSTRLADSTLQQITQ